MAEVVLGAFTSGSGPVMYRESAVEVYLAEVWGEWRYIPFLECLNASVAAAPGVGEATLRWHFGEVYRAAYGASRFHEPLFLNGYFVRVEVVNGWNRTPVFHGVIEHANVEPWGNAGYPHGVQEFKAYDLKHVLDRHTIAGAYTAFGFVDTPLSFNEVTGARQRLSGNRFLSGSEHLFGVANGGLWNNWQICDYLIRNYVNPNSVLVFEGIGDAQATLENIVEVWNFQGVSVKEALDRLIDPRRGVGWTIETDGFGVVYIRVFSYLGQGLSAGDAYVPPNDDQLVVDFSGYRDVNPEIQINELALFDAIEVYGGPMFTTGTWSYIDGTLMEGWSPSEEVTYATAAGAEEPRDKNDEFRQREEFRHVYQRHEVSEFWDGYLGDGEGNFYDALPKCLTDGTVIIGVEGYLANLYFYDRRFERELPWDLPGSNENEIPDKQPCFVVMGYLDPDDGETMKYALADRMERVNPDGINVTPLDNKLGILAETRINHELGLNHFDTETASPTTFTPSVDYLEMFFTGRFETSERLKCGYYVPGRVVTGTGKSLVIELPDTVFECVVPGTIVTVDENGDLVRQGSYGVIRDDSPYVVQSALTAAAWFGQVRATAGWTQPRISLRFNVGMLLAAVEGPEGVTEVGTPITLVSFDFTKGQQKTTVRTGYSEMLYR